MTTMRHRVYTFVLGLVGVALVTGCSDPEPPVLDRVEPAVLCSDLTDTTVSVIGDKFESNASVTLTATDDAEETYEADAVRVPSDTRLEFTLAQGVPTGSYDLTVSNGEGLDTTLEDALVVNRTPLVFFVDPPATYNGVTQEATIYATGLDASAEAVEIIDSGGAATALTASEPDPSNPNRILAQIPAGLPADLYRVSVTSVDGCSSALTGELTVSDTLSLSLEAIDPAFASPTRPTAVTLRSGGGLVAVPRVYLSPVGNPDATSTALRATLLEGASTLNGVVPEGLAPGAYNVVVVNPTGEVGVIEGGLTVTVDEPPVITSIAPASLDANTAGQAIDVVGYHFRGDPGSTSVGFLQCQDFDSGAAAPKPSAVVTSVALDRVEVTVDSTGVSAGTVCVVTLTTPDGASYNFSALTFKEPSQNLNPWSEGPAMVEARRAPAAVAGRPTQRSRFLYAIGGDDGDAAGAKTSIESSPIGVFGEMGAWTAQKNDLAAVWDATSGTVSAMPRAFAEAVQVDRFIYLLGGADADGPTATVLRAQILGPNEGPTIQTLDASLVDGEGGLGEGVWYYRVSALFPESDPHNPGGESLAGEIFPVQLPAVAERTIVLTLHWDPVPRASGYRVYRSPSAGAPADDVQLIGETSGTDATSLTDERLEADASIRPLPQGSLGVWHTAGSLGTARSAHASTVVAKRADPQTWWVYAGGGWDESGAPLASIELATIAIDDEGGQTLGQFAETTASLGEARAELGGFRVTGADSGVVGATDVWLYFGQGDTSGKKSTLFEAALVGPDGDLASLTAVDGPTPVRIGAADLAANGWLFLFGGSNGSASNGNDGSSEVLAPPPTLDSWDALGGGAMLEPRIYPGSAAESAFFFIVGGDGGSGPLESVEQTIQ